MLRAAIDIGAQVEHVGMAVGGRQVAHRSPAGRCQAASSDKAGNRHQRAGIAGRNAGIRLAGFDLVDTATRIDESFLLRKARAGDSSMPPTSEA
jgi:hypothetical protein